jgi:hypothetical protein
MHVRLGQVKTKSLIVSHARKAMQITHENVHVRGHAIENISYLTCVTPQVK